MPDAARRIATIDVGTNTALLLVAELGPEGTFTPVVERQRFVRLGEGVDATGRIGAPALERLRRVLVDYRDEARALGAERVLVAATSASRDAENRDALVDFVRRETGLSYEVLSGEEEAVWSFRGTLSGGDVRGEALVIDIGGGSTELIVGTVEDRHARSAAIHFRTSLDVGAVRLTERYFSAQPPARAEAERAAGLVRALLDAAAVPAGPEATFVGSAGTVSALAHVHTRQQDRPPHAPVVLAAAEVHDWRDRLLALPYDEVLALDPTIMQGRADVFPAGVLILDEVMRALGLARCRASRRGLRHGLVLRFLPGSDSG